MRNLIISICLVAATASGADVVLTWDPSPSLNVTNYVLYAHTNQFGVTNRVVTVGTNSVTLTNILVASVRVNVGPGRLAVVEDLRPGRWWFAATAEADGLESEPSNTLEIEVPAPPAAMRTLAVQWSATLTNWQDLGFFRLRMEDR